jgi:hypothetical protein
VRVGKAVELDSAGASAGAAQAESEKVAATATAARATFRAALRFEKMAMGFLLELLVCFKFLRFRGKFKTDYELLPKVSGPEGLRIS